MPDYGSVFSEDVAEGLGLARSQDRADVAKEYRDDPASAFTRMAALMQPPGNSIPVPFVTVVADDS